MSDLVLTSEEVAELYESLSEAERFQIDKLIVEDMAEMPWRPMIDRHNPDKPTPQQQAYDSKADILLYGGAAGGGKSSLIAGLAMTSHKRSVIYRREKTDLSALIDEVLSIHGSDKGWNSQKNILRLPGSRSISFEGMQHEKDKKVAQGKAKDLICYDEVTQFTESQVRYSMTWNRPTKEHIGQRCRVVMASNPPDTSEGDWVISFFAPWLDPEHPNPAKPGELRWFIYKEGEGDIEVKDNTPIPDPLYPNDRKKDIIPRSRTFIPSSVDDNVYLDGSGYKAGLQALPDVLREQMLHGNFMAGREDDIWQVIPTEWVELAMDRWTEHRPRDLKMTTLGFDPVRGGGDFAVLAPRYGWYFGELIIRPGKELKTGPENAAFATMNVRDGATIMVDIIGGAGASAYDQMKLNGLNVEAVDGRKTATGHAAQSALLLFFNERAKNWWRMREALDPDTGMDIALPPSRSLKADLCAPRWQNSKRGIQVESKSFETKDGFGDIKARLGRSPDEGDAVVMANRDAPILVRKPGNRGPSRANSSYIIKNFRGKRR